MNINFFNFRLKRLTLFNKSKLISDKVVQKYISNPDFPYLISFPRTGSHWLRVIMELYFKVPSLVRVFFFKNANKYTCYHHHDINLEIERNNVIYLYRNPIDTIYSYHKYNNLKIDDINEIKTSSYIYAKHLSKWIFEENFTEKKTIISYENLKTDINKTFQLICIHFNKQFDPNRLNKIMTKITKNEIKKKTRHDPNVINLDADYENERIIFKKKYSQLIYNQMFKINKKLEEIF